MYDRSKTVGASDAVQIQSGEWARLFDRKQSSDEAQYSLAAEIGHRLEAFNLELFEDDTDIHVEIREAWQLEPFFIADNSWCTYLPDGLIDPNTNHEFHKFSIPIEAKCINMMWNPINLLTKYMPQLQHAMRVMGAPYCYFSVIYLNIKYEWIKVEYDLPYDDALFEKEKLFQWFLETGTRPPEYLGKRKGGK